MLEVLKAGEYPIISVKFETDNIVNADNVTINATVTLAGVTRVEKNVEVLLKQVSSSIIQAKGKFDIKFSDYKIIRPSLLLVKVDDVLPVSFDIEISKI